MKFSGKLVYDKLVPHLFIYPVSTFHSIWLSSLKVVVVTSNSCEVLVLWIFQNSQETWSFLPISVVNLSVMSKSDLLIIC